MHDTIKVHVVKYGNRPNLVMRYIDPLTGKQVAKSAKTSRRRDAERAAAKWEAELREGRYHKPSRLTWAEFRQRYESEKMATLAPKSLASFNAAANHLERVVSPGFVARVDTSVLSRFQATLIGEGMRLTTLASHLRSLRAAFSWAERRGMIPKAPRVDMPKIVKGGRTMRGRPITGEEFDRMLLAVAAVRRVGVNQRSSDRTDVDIDRRQADLAKWRRLLRGLWLSGLRLGEALQLSWDQDAQISVQTDGKYPRLRIFAEAQKSKRDALLPISPDFAEFLLATPPAEREGLVFGIEGLVRGKPIDTQRASRIVSDMGEAAKIVVDANDLRPKTVTAVDKQTGKKTTSVAMVPRYATAHDLRRAFGTRWSKRVMPATLQKLMRHASIETTMRYYVEHHSDDVSADLWRWQSNELGSVAPETKTAAPSAAEIESRNSMACKEC